MREVSHAQSHRLETRPHCPKRATHGQGEAGICGILERLSQRVIVVAFVLEHLAQVIFGTEQFRHDPSHSLGASAGDTCMSNSLTRTK